MAGNIISKDYFKDSEIEKNDLRKGPPKSSPQNISKFENPSERFRRDLTLIVFKGTLVTKNPAD